MSGLNKNLSRREFLGLGGKAAATASMMNLLPNVMASPSANFPKGKAEHCIFLWLGGGMSQIDTFDPKKRGNPKTKQAGTDYNVIDTAVPGVKVTEHLSHMAKVMDRFTLLRTCTHSTVDEHATATHFVHTARPFSETIRYPSIGSIVAHELGQTSPATPGYVVIGYPNTSRDPGFLGPKHGYLYLTDTEAGPNGFVRHSGVDNVRQARREQLLAEVRQSTPDDAATRQYNEVIEQSLKLAGPDFMRLFQLKEERAELRNQYGSEFGQRCLLARRLVEAGVRFVEVSHNLNFVNGTGWDTHNEGQLKQYMLIQELDRALATLAMDLEQRKMLDKTLVVVGTEFGRPPEFDSGGGRGHQSKCFTLVMAGGGLKHGRAYGESDELSKKVLTNPVTMPDFHATICAALGINPAKELYDASRPVPITDGGKPVAALFA
ncbi:MAG TPA: DUF1501 domain-containing protein [Verrucomicrobiae bacterium]